MSYSTTVPIADRTVTEENRHTYFTQMKNAKVSRIFLTADRYFDMQEAKEPYKKLAEDVASFEMNGFEVGVWICETIGHGSALGFDYKNKAAGFTEIRGLNGETSHKAYCPLDDEFRASICEMVKEIAKTKAKLIILDDDFRLSCRSYGIGCTCDRHLAKISKGLGEEVSIETLRNNVYVGKPNKYRKAWRKAQGESLVQMAKEIRRAVDEVDPKTRLGVCTAFTLCDTDGTDGIEIAKALAGENTRPFLRLLLAPYWRNTASAYPLPNLLEFSVLYNYFCRGFDCEILSEGDTYTRPRYNVPSSTLELYDAYLRADGSYDGILKYMVDYTSSPSYETGYVDRHIRDLPLLEEFSEAFRGGKREGVRVYDKCHKLEEAILPEHDFDFNVLSYYPSPKGASMLARCSIPVSYDDEEMCGVCFGLSAQVIGEKALSRGLILDASAAVFLSDKGIDVGIGSVGQDFKTSVSFERFADPEQKVFIARGDARLYPIKPKDGAVVESYVNDKPFSYRYENAKGQRFLVFCFDSLEVPENSGLLNSYARQSQLISAIEWMSGKPLSAKSLKNPDFDILCKRLDDGSLAVGLFNCHEDSILQPEILLGEKYTTARFIGCEGHLEDGRIVLSELRSFGFAAVILK